MATVKYSKEHEWVRVEGDVATIGITKHAAEQLGDLVFVELPAVGKTVAPGDEAAVVESVKAASAIYTPVAGTVEKINPELEGTPELINQQPYQAFIFAIRFSDTSGLDQLLDAESYRKHVEQEKASH